MVEIQEFRKCPPQKKTLGLSLEPAAASDLSLDGTL